MPPPRRGGAGALSGHRRPSSVHLSVCLMSRTSALTRKPKGLGRRNFAQGYPRSHATTTPTSRSKGQKSRSRGQLVQRSEMCEIFRKRIKLRPSNLYAHRPRAVLAPGPQIGPKLGVAWGRDPISKFWDPLNITQTEKATIFKFGTHIGRGQFLPMDHKLPLSGRRLGVRDPIPEFWDPLNISQTEKATIFKFGMHIGRGQFLPRTTNWPLSGRGLKYVTQFRNFGIPSIFRKRKKLRSSNLARTGGGILWRPPSRTTCFILTLIRVVWEKSQWLVK